MAEKREWTDEQRLAINTRDRTLLISAAAGSGKTATLTERIIRSLLDEENPENINEILIVTFTKAAVAELRERIGRAVRDALAENPESERLRRQLALLPSAKIQTIDSFCVDILRKNCDKVGVSPSFRVPDEAEAKLLAITTMERLIDTVYDGLLREVASPEEFENLSDGLTDSRGMSELSSVLLGIYDDLVDVEDGVDSLLPLAEQYSAGLSSSGIIAYAVGRVRDMASHYLALYRRAIAEMSTDSDKSAKFIDMSLADAAYLERLSQAEGYTDIRALLCETARVDKPRLSASSSEGARFAIKVRCELDEDIEYFAEKIFFLEEGALASLFGRLCERVTVLHRFLSHFDRVFMAEKRRLAICEYSDIERYAYACLYDGEPTEVARSEAARYSSVYIDEYQDVNGIQNRIFEAISRPDNRFMVGDIKQSIYGFRGARPEIFAGMKKAFPPLSESHSGGSASIFMSKNFRSENPIIELVNDVFDKIFEHSGESIGYRSDDRLECGKKNKITEPYPEIHVLPKLSVSTDREAEPRFTAELISSLLGESLVGGGEIRPKDVSILLRSDLGRVSDFASAISDRGIPVRIPEKGDFFLCPEILLSLSLLCAVDNPRRDIYLAALMRSPLFDFSFDELISIRRESDSATLYDALVEYCEAHPNFERGAGFVSELTRYRRISEGLPVDEVVSRLYRETGLVSTASAAARANLDLLYEYARSFEASSFKGLYNFIRYVNSVIDKEMRVDEKQDAADEDSVKIITAHKSKGLEFPVVIMADTAKSLSHRDRGRLHYAEGFGVSMTVRTESGLAVLENPVNNIISDYNSRLDFEEEMRVLYVALTRARERLYVVGTSQNTKIDDFTSKVDFLRDTLSSYSVYKLPSYLAAVLATGALSARVFYHDATEESEEPEAEQMPDASSDVPSEVCTVSFSEEELLSRFDYSYPDEYLTNLPKKMAVSYLYPTVLDGSEDEPALDISELSRGERPKNDKLGKIPRFLSDTDPDDSAKRGIATHLFMQFQDLDNLTRGGASEELMRLVREKFISAEDAERVRLDEIELFRRSRLIEEMRTAKKIYRELRFNVSFPASIFTSDENKRKAYEDKKILVQGVIDCIIEREDGELLLIDYKTDRLTRAELENKALAAEKLTRVHTSQLSYYRMAVEKMFGRAPLSVAVYSLPLGDTVEIKDFKM